MDDMIPQADTSRTSNHGHYGYPPLQPHSLSHHAHTLQGAAAAAVGKQKCNAFQWYRMRGLTFFAFALENYGYLDTQAMDYRRHIAFAAASTGAVSYGSFVASVHMGISVVVNRNHGIFRAGVQLYTRASGHARVPGHLVSMVEIE
jgi:hypothetical protein